MTPTATSQLPDNDTYKGIQYYCIVVPTYKMQIHKASKVLLPEIITAYVTQEASNIAVCKQAVKKHKSNYLIKSTSKQHDYEITGKP